MAGRGSCAVACCPFVHSACTTHCIGQWPFFQVAQCIPKGRTEAVLDERVQWHRDQVDRVLNGVNEVANADDEVGRGATPASLAKAMHCRWEGCELLGHAFGSHKAIGHPDSLGPSFSGLRRLQEFDAAL